MCVSMTRLQVWSKMCRLDAHLDVGAGRGGLLRAGLLRRPLLATALLQDSQSNHVRLTQPQHKTRCHCPQ